LTAITDLYLLSRPRQTQASALRERDYFEAKIPTITSVNDLLSDPRLYDYVRKAFNLNELFVVKSTLEQILTSDLSDPNSYAQSLRQGSASVPGACERLQLQHRWQPRRTLSHRPPRRRR
jgi:hypothetical protein